MRILDEFKGLDKLGNIVAETLFLVMLTRVAKLSGKPAECFAAPVAKRGNIVAKTSELRMREMINSPPLVLVILPANIIFVGHQ